MGANLKKILKSQLLLGSFLSVGAWAYRVEDVNENIQAASHRSEICKVIVGDYLDFLDPAECRGATLKVNKRYYDVVPSSNAEEMTGYAWSFEKGELKCKGSVTLNIKQPVVDSEGRVKWVGERAKWSFNVEDCGSESLSALKNAEVGDENVVQVGLSFDAEFPWEDGAPEAEDEVLPSEIPANLYTDMAAELSLRTDRPDYNWVKTEFYKVKSAAGAVIGYIGLESIHNSEDSDNYTYDDVVLIFDLQGRVVKESEW